MNLRELNNEFRNNTHVSNDVFQYMQGVDPRLSSLPEDQAKFAFFNYMNGDVNYRNTALQSFLSCNPNYEVSNSEDISDRVRNSGQEFEMSHNLKNSIIVTACGVAGLYLKQKLNVDHDMVNLLAGGTTVIGGLGIIIYGLRDTLKSI